MDETRNDAPLTGEAPQTAKPQPLRRVGSFTLGVCLIAAGIFFPLHKVVAVVVASFHQFECYTRMIGGGNELAREVVLGEARSR